MNPNSNQHCYRGQSRPTPYMNSGMQGHSNPYRSTNMPNRMEGRSENNTCSGNKPDPCKGTSHNRIDQFPVGMAYVPWQEFKDLYDPHQGLERGTLFKELDYPFYGKRGNY